MRVLVVLNKAATEQLIILNNPSWLDKVRFKQDLSPAAIWDFKNAGTMHAFS
jgi:hypothetical protein